MKLNCIGNYSNGAISHKAGDVIEDSDEVCEFLLRDSPGSFEYFHAKKADPVAEVSTETVTGIDAPDRRARGGNKR